ncbi:Peroxin-3 [Multifurca ochricompacta]|uniref:Peroxin-3 n=1 Tax=Multifurca ochricompacta TaxID=376703 RepID=A0AAD4MA49_9AGAM|nr:Peroxin-3 [Multifurca ochricompacta]
MLNSVSNYVYEKRTKLSRAAGVIGGLYLVGQYASARITDTRDRILEDRIARENIRKRFRQNMQDISFTIMTYMPLLSKHILDEMDVESLTAELQSLSRAAKRQNVRPVHEQSALPQHQQSPRVGSIWSLESSVELVHSSDAQSETSSASFLSVSPRPEVSQLAEPTPSAPFGEPKTLSESVVSSSVVSSSSDSGLVSAHVSDSYHRPSTDRFIYIPTECSARSKADLWREVKLLTVTRTLTVLYSITLLTIFTNIQLSLLGRYKFIQSVMQLEHDEDAHSRRQSEPFVSSMLFSSLVDLTRSQDIEALLDQKTGWEDSIWQEGVDAETERKFLTLSWWILNVGWKDVGERVRRGVEEVFEGVSLKSKIGAIELHRLISDVRRRVEHEITFEGTERRINFLSTLLPPTSSALSHLLTRGGFPPAHSDTHEPAFTALMEETRDLLTSSDFALVLERALDRGTSLLFDGLSRNVFAGEEVRLRTAGVLPGLARWSSLALNGMPNELVDNLSDLHEVASFAAIIFSNYGDHFR